MATFIVETPKEQVVRAKTKVRVIIFVSHWITPEVYSLVNIMRCVNILFATGRRDLIKTRQQAQPVFKFTVFLTSCTCIVKSRKKGAFSLASLPLKMVVER